MQSITSEWETHLREERRVSIEIFSVPSVKVVVHSNVLCDDFICTDLGLPRHVFMGELGSAPPLHLYNLKVKMCGKGLVYL